MVRKFLLALLLLAASPAFAQVAFVSDIENKDETGSATGLTLTSVLGTGGNCITVDVHWRNNASQTLTSITFNGSSIASNEIGTQLNQSGGSQRNFYFCGTMADANVVIGMSAAVPTILATARVWSGVNTASPIGDFDISNNVGELTTTPAVTAGDDDMIADSISIRATPTGITAGADQTEVSSQSTAGTLHMRASWQDGAASDDVMSYSWTGSQNWTHKVYVLSAPGGASGLLLRRRRAANDDHILERPIQVAANY